MGLFGRKRKAKYEYKTVKVSGTLRSGRGYTKAVDKTINKMAKDGWVLDDTQEMGRGKENNHFWTSSVFTSTRYVMLTFRRVKE